MPVVRTRREALDSPDGVNVFIMWLAQALMDLGHDAMVVVGSLNSYAEYQRVVAPRCDLPTAAALRAVLNDDALWCRLSAGARRMGGWLGAHRAGPPYGQRASA